MATLRNEIAEAIGIVLSDIVSDIEYRVLESTKESGYTSNSSNMIPMVI